MKNEQQLPDTFIDSERREWNVGQFLGCGTYGIVHVVVHKETNQEFAGKFVKKSKLKTEKNKRRMKKEISIHRSLGYHPHVVEYKAFVKTKDYYIIIMELCKHKSMLELLCLPHRLTEEEIGYYFKQIVQGVKHIHSCCVLHSDLKVGNIFLDANQKVKIGDFGLSHQLEHDDVGEVDRVGTPNYISPEVVKSGFHSYKGDVWSLGVILYTMAIGKCPFETESIGSTYWNIQNVIFHFPTSRPISAELKDLIKCILKEDSDDRLTLDEILGHSFFNFQNKNF